MSTQTTTTTTETKQQKPMQEFHYLTTPTHHLISDYSYMDQHRYHDMKNESFSSSSISTRREGGGRSGDDSDRDHGILRHRLHIHTTTTRKQSNHHDSSILQQEQQLVVEQEDDFVSPNQVFIEYLLCFLLRKIAFVFYVVFTMIDSILSFLTSSWYRRRPREHSSSSSSSCSKLKTTMSSCRSRTCTEDTVSSYSSSTYTIHGIESPKTCWYSSCYSNNKNTKHNDWKRDENDEQDYQHHQQQQQQWGHFTFIE